MRNNEAYIAEIKVLKHLDLEETNPIYFAEKMAKQANFDLMRSSYGGVYDSALRQQKAAEEVKKYFKVLRYTSFPPDIKEEIKEKAVVYAKKQIDDYFFRLYLEKELEARKETINTLLEERDDVDSFVMNVDERLEEEQERVKEITRWLEDSPYSYENDEKKAKEKEHENQMNPEEGG